MPRAKALPAGSVPSVAVGVARCHRIPSHIIHRRTQVVGFLGGEKGFILKDMLLATELMILELEA